MTRHLDVVGRFFYGNVLEVRSVPLWRRFRSRIEVPGSLAGIIRVLAHYHAPADHVARHVYLGEARALRADLDAAQ